MDLPPRTWREVWDREAEDPVPDPLVEMAKRKRHRIDGARDAANYAARHAATPLPSAVGAGREELEAIAERAREVLEEWRASRVFGPMTLARALISLRESIRHAARGMEPVEPDADAEG